MQIQYIYYGMNYIVPNGSRPSVKWVTMVKEYRYTRERHVSEGGSWIMQGGCVGADSWSLFCDYPFGGEFTNGMNHQT